jgi:SPP1 gp7 family putative phage head morphogenesis protein
MADPAHEQTDDMIEEIRQRISREYLRAYEGAEEKLADYLRRFEAKDRIHAEAVRRGEETEADYREWRRGQILVGERWQELVDTLAEDYRNVDRVAASIVNGHAPDAYAVNHDYATFQVEKGSNLDTSYTLYDRATVERLIRDQPDLLPAVRVDGKRDLAWNRRHIASAITQGVLQGESMDKVARRVRSVADMDYRAAMRTARTAMTSAQNAGRVDAYRRAEGMGIHVRKQWLATLDGRTRHSHRQLDGEVAGMGESFSNGLSYPGDPSGTGSEVYNCRCTLVPVVDGADPSEGVRHSNLGGVSYEEWRGERERRAPTGESAVVHRYEAAASEGYVKSGSYPSWLPGTDSAAMEAVERYTSDQYRSVNGYLRRTGDFAPDGRYGKALSRTPDVEFARANPLVRQEGESLPAFLRRRREDGLSDIRAAVMAEDAVTATVREMDALIDGYDLPNDVVLFRRVDANALPNDPRSIVGGTYEDRAYMSTSIFERNNFVGSDEYLMRLRVPAGRGRGMYVNDMSSSKGEHEFVLARGSRFRVVSVTEEGGKFVIDMELEV